MDSNAPGTVGLREVIDTELEIIAKRRARIRKEFNHTASGREAGHEGEPAIQDTLVGLALSGGGIRSAVTNLGVLQGLARSGVLRLVDYLSTVSGGGYIGGCLSSLLSMRQPALEKQSIPATSGDAAYDFTQTSNTGHDTSAAPALFTTSWSSFPLKDSPVGDIRQTGPTETPSCPTDRCDQAYITNFKPRDQMVHLRNRSSYLIPRALPMGSQVIKAVGAVTANTILPLLWFLCAVCTMTALYMLLVSFTCYLPYGSNGCFNLTHHAAAISIPAKTAGMALLDRLRYAWSGLLHIAYNELTALQGLVTSNGGIAVFVIGLISGLFLPSCSRIGRSAEIADENPENLAENKFLICLLWSCTGILYVAILLCCHQALSTGSRAGILFVPTLFSASAFAGTLLRLISIANRRKDHWNRCHRSTLFLQAGFFLYATGLTFAVALLPGFIMEGNPWFVMLFQALLALGIRLWMGRDKKTSSGTDSSTQSLMSKIKEALLNLLVPTFIFFAIVLAGSLINKFILQYHWPQAITTLPLIKSLALFTLLFLLLCTIDYNKISHHYFYRDRLSEAFLLTFARRLTDVSQHIVEMVRNAVDMPLAFLHGNEEHTGKCAARGPYHLINATLNLTAAKDMKGFRRQAEIFLFSRCFIGSERTGFTHTSQYKEGLKVARALTISGAAVTSVMGKSGSLAESFACTVLGIRLGYWLRNPARLDEVSSQCAIFKPFKWMKLLFLELIRYTNARSKYIYLSDGGHNGDNLGIIPLFQRRVRLIIASDAEHDPQYIFDSLNSSLRQAYVDYGIKVDLKITRDNLVPNDKNMTKTHFVVGRILYPDRPWQASWLVVIKNSISGDELAPILNYRKKCKAFPQESTGDQFFTEEQFEAYRALGRHTAENAFPPEKLSATEQGKDPWADVERIGQILQHEKPHRWDDLFVALWETEQVDFSRWKRFKDTLPEFNCTSYTGEMLAQKTAAYRDGVLPGLYEQMEYLKQWIGLHDMDVLDRHRRVPRTWMEFMEISKKIWQD